MMEKLNNVTSRVSYSIEENRKKMLLAIYKHYLLRQSWNSISMKSGFNYHIDYLHMNDVGANMIAELILSSLNHID